MTMKFGASLDKIKGMSDPAWDAYWPNYNILKRLIKGLRRKDHISSLVEPQVSEEVFLLKRERGEVVFFKLLSAELMKASHFFEQMQQTYLVQAQHIGKELESVDSVQDPDLANLILKIFRLHQHLLRLEAFAIMTYCGCSKILKKHDKVTGFHTRDAFMTKVVHPSCIAHTPQVDTMLGQCQDWLELPQLSRHWKDSGKPTADDQCLFLEMLQHLNPNILNSTTKLMQHKPTSLLSLLSVSSSSSLNQETNNWKRAFEASTGHCRPRQMSYYETLDTSEGEDECISNGDDADDDNDSNNEEGSEEDDKIIAATSKRSREFDVEPAFKKPKLNAQ